MVARQMLEQYGAPNEATPTKLFWCRNGPWKRSELTSDVVLHNLPTPHSDYLTKPFNHLELLARLRALARRSGQTAGPPDPGMVLGDIALDSARRTVRIRGDEVKLTSTEYRLLEELARHVGTVVPHRSLLERVWGPEWIGDPHYLKVFVRRLRQKLGNDAENPRYIQTEWGIGYRFVPPDHRSRSTSHGIGPAAVARAILRGR